MDNISLVLIKKCLDNLNYYSELTKDKYCFGEKSFSKEDGSVELEQRIWRDGNSANPIWVNRAVAKNEEEVDQVKLKMSERFLNEILSQGVTSVKIN